MKLVIYPSLDLEAIDGRITILPITSLSAKYLAYQVLSELRDSQELCHRIGLNGTPYICGMIVLTEDTPTWLNRICTQMKEYGANQSRFNSYVYGGDPHTDAGGDGCSDKIIIHFEGRFEVDGGDIELKKHGAVTVSHIDGKILGRLMHNGCGRCSLIFTVPRGFSSQVCHTHRLTSSPSQKTNPPPPPAAPSQEEINECLSFIGNELETAFTSAVSQPGRLTTEEGYTREELEKNLPWLSVGFGGSKRRVEKARAAAAEEEQARKEMEEEERLNLVRGGRANLGRAWSCHWCDNRIHGGAAISARLQVQTAYGSGVTAGGSGSWTFVFFCPHCDTAHSISSFTDLGRVLCEVVKARCEEYGNGRGVWNEKNPIDALYKYAKKSGVLVICEDLWTICAQQMRDIREKKKKSKEKEEQEEKKKEKKMMEGKRMAEKMKPELVGSRKSQRVRVEQKRPSPIDTSVQIDDSYSNITFKCQKAKKRW
jgi:hypothetical protein